MKRFVLVLLAVAMMFALCAVAEEVTEEVTEEVVEEVAVEEEPVVMYVANCGAVTVYAEADYASEALGTVLANMEVEVTGDIIDNGKYDWAPVVTADVEGNELVGYVNYAFLDDERVMVNKTGMMVAQSEGNISSTGGTKREGIYLHVLPSAKSEKVDLPFLKDSLIPDGAVFEIEYYVGDFAFISAVVNGEKVDLGYAAWQVWSKQAGKYVTTIKECDTLITKKSIYVDKYMKDDPWNDIR